MLRRVDIVCAVGVLKLLRTVASFSVCVGRNGYGLTHYTLNMPWRCPTWPCIDDVAQLGPWCKAYRLAALCSYECEFQAEQRGQLHQGGGRSAYSSICVMVPPNI